MEFLSVQLRPGFQRRQEQLCFHFKVNIEMPNSGDRVSDSAFNM
jgi:hypothetical protein